MNDIQKNSSHVWNISNKCEKCLSGWPVAGGGYLAGIPLLNWSGMFFLVKTCFVCKKNEQMYLVYGH